MRRVMTYTWADDRREVQHGRIHADDTSPEFAPRNPFQKQIWYVKSYACTKKQASS